MTKLCSLQLNSRLVIVWATASVDSVTEMELEEEDVTAAELHNVAAAVEEEEEGEGVREGKEGPSPPPDPILESVDERQQLLVDSELEEDSSTRRSVCISQCFICRGSIL